MRCSVHQYGKYSWLAGMMLLTFLSLQWNDNLLEDTTIISKTLYFAAGVIFLLPVGYLLFIRRKEWPVNLTAIDLILILWVLYIMIRIGVAEEPCRSPRLIDLLALSCYFILLKLAPRITFTLLFYTIASVGIVQAVYGILQLYNLVPANGPFKLTGSFFNLGAYSAFLAISCCISLGLVLFPDQRTQTVSPGMRMLRIIPVINVVLSIIVLPVSLNRTAWIVVIIVTVFLYAHRMHLKQLALTKKIMTGAIAVILFTAVILIKKDSASGRMLVWKVTTNMIKHNPVLGVGYDRFQTEYMNYQAAYLAKSGSSAEKQLADNVYYGFNDLLQLTAELGIPGSIIVLLLITAIYRANDGKHVYSHIAKGIVLAYFIISLFYYPHYILALKVPLVIALAWLSRISEIRPLFSCYFRLGNIQHSVALAGLLLCSTGCLMYLWQLRSSYSEWRQAQYAYQNEAYARSLYHFHKALPLLKHNGVFLSQMGKTYLLADSLDKAVWYLTESKRQINNMVVETALGDVNKRLGRFSLAEQYYKSALDMVPNRFYTEYLLLELYVASNQRWKACQKSTDILNKKVKVFSTAVRQIVDRAKVVHATNNCNQ